MLRSLCFSAALLSAFPAFAKDPMDDVLSHRVIAGWTQADGTRMAAIELTLATGWKTYWRSPGDAGIPPEFDWRRARNLSGVEIHWPAPYVFWQSGMRSIGYKERVVLPMTIAPKSSDRDIRLRGEMSLGICSDICVPASITIDAVVPSNVLERPAPLVAALASLPYSATEAGVKSAECQLSPTEHGLRVDATVHMPSSGAPEEAVIETKDPGIWVSDAETSRHGGTLSISAEMMPMSDGPMVINRSEIRITVLGGKYAVDIQGCTS